MGWYNQRLHILLGWSPLLWFVWLPEVATSRENYNPLEENGIPLYIGSSHNGDPQKGDIVKTNDGSGKSVELSWDPITVTAEKISSPGISTWFKRFDSWKPLGTGTGLSVNPNFPQYSEFSENVQQISWDLISPVLLTLAPVGGFESAVGGWSSLRAFFFTRFPRIHGSSLSPKSIHFMQSSIKNATGEFTVLANARNLASGKLNPNILRMNVWKDASGKIWTLDHRRLAAFRLSGLKRAPVNWANQSIVKTQMWKMTTKTGGVSIRIKFGNGTRATIK